MNTITLNYSNKEDLELLLKLAERIGIFPSDENESSTNEHKESNTTFNDLAENKKTAINNLTKIKAFSEIKDPVEWQRELRKDRKLF